MKLKYQSLDELYSLTGLLQSQIAKKIHKSPHTMRKWKSVYDVPDRLLYQIENLVIYKANRGKKSLNTVGLKAKGGPKCQILYINLKKI